MSKLSFSWMPAHRRVGLAGGDLFPFVTFPSIAITVNPLSGVSRTACESAVMNGQPFYDFMIPPRMGYRLESATVRMPESLVMTADGKIVDESLSTPNYLHTMGLLLEFFRYKPTQRHMHPGFMLSMPYQKNYHLWLHYALPRLACLENVSPEDAKDIVVLVSDDAPRFVHDSLASYSKRYPQLQVNYLPSGNHVLPTLYLMQPMSVKDLPNPIAVCWLRRTFLDDINVSALPMRRLYLTRRGALERDVLNEDQLLNFLAAYGFETFDCGVYSFEQQVEAFQKAEIIIGPHGASFSNLAFCAPGTLVVELIGGSHFMPCFAFLASQRSLRYFPVSLDDAGAHMRSNINNLKQLADIFAEENIL